MEVGVLKAVGAVAGVGGLALGVLLLVFRDIVRLKIFPKLAPVHAFVVLVLLLVLVWSVAIAGLVTWVKVATFEKSAREAAKGGSGGVQDRRRPDIYEVRVQVVDPAGNPVAGATVRASAGNEPHLLPDGWWEIQVPSAKVPANGRLVLWAQHPDWAGARTELPLAEDAHPSVEMALKPPRTHLGGRVLDGNGQTLAGARVLPEDGGSAEFVSRADGSFDLELGVPAGTVVALRAEHPRWGVKSNIFCYAGRDSCSITLDKR